MGESAREFGMIVVLVGGVALGMLGIERMWPGRVWPRVSGWWTRALLLNAIQIAIVLAAGSLWDGWMLRHRPPWADSIGRLGPIGGAAVGYLAITFVYYWWHRARHASDWLWRWLHQVHHSPQRLEIVTSFYKHPIEIAANGILSSAILYQLVGVGTEAAMLAVSLTGLAELFYHWNIATPHWLGFVIQRPESHCVHHEEGHHHNNYGDLPLWDMLFGTFENPANFDRSCGFGAADERRLGEMLLGRDVADPLAVKRSFPFANAFAKSFTASLLLLLGLLQMVADIAEFPRIRGFALATGASPAPKVFSAVEGLETYSSHFFVSFRDRHGALREVEISPENYERLKGPYNRRNTYGAVFAYGPVWVGDPRIRPMFDSVSRHALCGPAVLLAEIGVDTTELPPGDLRDVRVRVEPRSGTDVDFPLQIEVQC